MFSDLLSMKFRERVDMESTPTGYLKIVGADSISALLLEVSQAAITNTNG